MKLFFTLTLISALIAHGAKQPNIVLLLVDDAGYNDFGFQNNEAAYRKATPNIDTLARDGARFTQAYVSANVCAPSRAGLMTGMYQTRGGFRDNLPSYWNKPEAVWFTEGWKQIGLDTNLKTIGDRMGALGYYTGVVGKWHLGYADHFAPHNRGFDFFKGIRAGSRSFFPLKKIDVVVPPDAYHQIEKNGVFLPESDIVHVTQSQGDAAIEFIDEAQANEKPFFLFLSFTAPHTPLQSDKQSLAKAKKLFPGKGDKAHRNRQQYMGLVIGVDREVGRVLGHLEELGLEEDTMIVFLSDNGGSAKNASNNDPLRGNKWTPFEGGYRIPMVMKWPGVINGGSTISEPVISLDLLPTFLSAAGGDIAEELDGVELQPTFSGSELESRTFCWWDCNSEGLTSTVLDHPWKLVMREDADRGSRKFRVKGDPNPWLFNVEDDLAETTNLAKQYPEKVQQLKAIFDEWVSEMPTPRW
jgi:arylsulfatase A-like enzyme